MAFLKIDQESFDTERKVVEEESRMGENQPYGTLEKKLAAEIFKVHPYRWTPIGNIADLRASSVPELRDFWNRYYVPSNTTLIIVGAVKNEKAQEFARKYFGWIPRYQEPNRITVREPEMNNRPLVKIKQNNAPLPGVGVVYRTVPLRDPNTVVFDVIAEILGGGNSSRLYRELVAQKQAAVFTKAYSWSLEQDGVFGAAAGLPPVGGDPNTVLGIMEKHIEILRTESVSQRELTKAKNQLLRNLVTQNLKVDRKAASLGEAAVDMEDVSQVNRQMVRIERVTAADIMRVASSYLTTERILKVKVDRHIPDGQERADNEPPITGKKETIPPASGRLGEVPSPDFPRQAPFAKSLPDRLTPEYSSTVLDNGLKVLVVPNHEVPFVSVQMGLLAALDGKYAGYGGDDDADADQGNK